jgi:hypothetical protein
VRGARIRARQGVAPEHRQQKHNQKGLSTPKSVQKLQTALHAKAKAEAGYRFYALYDKISREDILAHAYAQCRSNKGAPGVDGQDKGTAPIRRERSACCHLVVFARRAECRIVRNRSPQVLGHLLRFLGIGEN